MHEANSLTMGIWFTHYVA